MDGDGGDAAVVDGDRCLGLPDLSKVKMDPWWMSSPSRSLPEVRFLRFLVVMYVVPPIQLHGAKLFEAAASMATIRRQLYGRTNLVLPYSWSLNLLEVPTEVGFLLVLLIFPQLAIFAVFYFFSLRHNWSKNCVHCIHHLS